MTAQLGLLLGAMLALMFAGVPIFLALALSVVIYAGVYAPVMPPLVIVQTFVQGLDNIAFTAIPYFFLAGTIMNAGGMSQRLLRVARALLGAVPGGLSHANVVANMVFAGVSGSAVADAAAVGSLMIPAMKRDGYGGAYAAAVTASAATIGPIIPPSIPMVIFGLFTGASITSLFLGGVVPGLLMGVFLLITTLLMARARRYPSAPWEGWHTVMIAFRDAALALLLPVLVITGLITGVATTSEIGALAAVYATVVSLMVYRQIDLRGLWAAILQSAVDAARILIIIAVSGAFVWIVADLGVGPALVSVLMTWQLSATAIVVVIAAGLVLASMVLEPIILLVVIVPILVPAALAAGADLIHLGVVAVLATSIGLIVPPIGILIYLTAAQADAPARDVIREMLPFIAALLALLLLVAIYPPLVTWLPRLVRR